MHTSLNAEGQFLAGVKSHIGGKICRFSSFLENWIFLKIKPSDPQFLFYFYVSVVVYIAHGVVAIPLKSSIGSILAHFLRASVSVQCHTSSKPNSKATVCSHIVRFQLTYDTFGLIH